MRCGPDRRQRSGPRNELQVIHRSGRHDQCVSLAVERLLLKAAEWIQWITCASYRLVFLLIIKIGGQEEKASKDDSSLAHFRWDRLGLVEGRHLYLLGRATAADART